MIFFHKKQTGFSLVETLVAISILLIVIVGPMTISTKAAKSSSFATEQIQAFFLAQEGIELVEKARNDLLLVDFDNETNVAWNNFTADTSGAIYRNCHITFNPAGCGLEWDSVAANGVLKAPVVCGPTNCLIQRSAANLDTTRSRFTHITGGSNVPTPFTRQIYFDNRTSGEVYVRSVVTWRTGSLVAGQKVEVDTYLYDLY